MRNTGEWAVLQLGLPSRVWRHCRDGAAHASVLQLDRWERSILDVTRAHHVLPVGPHRLTIEGPWYRAEHQFDILPGQAGRLRLTERNFSALPIDLITVAREQAHPASSGTIWVRVMGLRLRPVRGATADLLDGASLRIRVPGRVTRATVAVVSPDQGARQFVLPMVYSQRAGRSEGRLILRRHGRALFVSGRMPTGEARLIAASLESGDTESAGRAAAGLLQRFRRTEHLSGVDGAVVASALAASGRFGDLAPWVGRHLNDPVAASDLHAVMAEWYAQFGCHLAALNLLAHIPRLGRPVLSRSYAIALNLLSAYAGSGPVVEDVYANLQYPNSYGRLGYLGGEEDPRSIPHVRGQELEPWNRTMAGEAAARLSDGVNVVDRGHLFLTYQGAQTNELQLRLQNGWKRFEWHLAAASAGSSNAAFGKSPGKQR